MLTARRFHLVTAVVATVAIALQVVLVVQGGQVLDEVTPPALPVRVLRFVAYFTVQSNVLVAVVSWQLARDPARDGAAWPVVRLAALTGIAVTGLVHFVLLRPLLDLDGADWVADKALHMAVPLLAVVGWAAYGPRPRSSRRTAVLVLVWPVAWLALTLVVGATTGWYPYPFLDPDKWGVGGVAKACGGVTVLFVALVSAVVALDRRLPATADSGS